LSGICREQHALHARSRIVFPTALWIRPCFTPPQILSARDLSFDPLPDAERARKVRLALNLAVDKQAIVQQMLGGLGSVLGAWLTYPTDPWATEASLKPYPYDPSDGREDVTQDQVRGTRGGGQDSNAEELTVTQRGRHVSRNPRGGHHNIGFRCAR